jgi:hypothetical protein
MSGWLPEERVVQFGEHTPLLSGRSRGDNQKNETAAELSLGRGF